MVTVTYVGPYDVAEIDGHRLDLTAPESKRKITLSAERLAQLGNKYRWAEVDPAPMVPVQAAEDEVLPRPDPVPDDVHKGLADKQPAG